jgi:hypothetical protein
LDAQKSAALNLKFALLPTSKEQEVRNQMSDLAFNVVGEPFEVPPQVTGWRVKRIKAKGAPEIVYGREGAPLVLSASAALEDLRREAGEPGKYRLDPIDDHLRTIEGAQPSYLYVHPDTPQASGAIPAAYDVSRTATGESALVEIARMNSSLAQTVICQFPVMMEAAANLLRAADGAGLPARPPLLTATTDQEDDELEEGELPPEASPQSNNVAALLAQVLPPLLLALTGGQVNGGAGANSAPHSKVPEGAPVANDGPKKATRSSSMPTAAASSAPAGPATSSASTASQLMAAMSPTTMAHFLSVQQALTLEERALAQGILSELRPDEVSAWLQELSALSVPAAVERIRSILHGAQPNATPSHETESL